MKTGNTGIVRSSTPARVDNGTAKYRTVKKLSRLSAAVEAFEPLEPRQMMSVTPLSVPKVVSITATSPTTINLAWSDKGATPSGYKLLRSANSGAYAQVAQIASSTTLSYTDTTVSPHTSYRYKIEAYNSTGTSAAALTATVQTPSVETPHTTSAAAISVPIVTSITATSPTSINVGWSYAGATPTGFKVLRSANSGTYAQVAQIASPATLGYIDTTVSPHTSYSYKIEAYTATSTSAAATTATVKTPLVAPSWLSANAASGTQIVLKWTDNDTTAGGYNILRGVNGGAFSLLKSVTGAAVSTFTDATASDGKAFSYEVQAVNGTNTSAVSGIATGITPLLAPSKLSATAQSSTWMHVTWTDNDPAATGYQVLRSTDGIHYTTISTLTNGSSNSFDDKAVASFSTYYYEVQATTSVTTSPVSASAKAVTPLSAPTWVMPVVIGQNSIRFTWADTDPNAKGYIVLQAAGSGAFSQVASINSASTTSWTDTTFTSNAQYSFEIEAINGTSTSTPSTVFTMVTPLLTPTSLKAVATSGTSVTLSWTDVDPNATSYTILRSTNGSAFQILTTVSGATAASYTDGSVNSGHSYAYDVMAAAGNNMSGMSTPATAVTPISAPTGLQANVSTAGSIGLSWTDQDSSATAYTILRSTDNINFSKIASVSGQSISSYVDATVSTAHTYYYQVQALNSYATSAVSNTATVNSPLLAPTGLAANASGSSINLTWSDKDASATGFVVLRSTDGVNFTQLAQLSGTTVQSYADTTATAGQKYYYQVTATATGLTSAASNTANCTIAAPAPTPTPTPTRSNVTVLPLWTNELVVTSTGTSDTIAITESGRSLTVVADGQTTTIASLPTAGLFVYTRGGTDSINIDSSVTVRTTVETIDAAVDTITSAGSNVNVWDDSTDIFTGTGTVHSVSAFAGGVSKAAGASLPDPHDEGTPLKIAGSLFGSGPVAGDVNQGEVGDCYFLSSLAAFATEQPSVLEQSAVDMNDGTYVVQFMNGTTPSYVRVNADMPFSGSGYLYARTGSSGSIWAPIMEKAYAFFRTGANTYASLNSGWMGNVYSALGVNNNAFFPSSMSSSAFYTMISNDLANGKAVTLGTGNGAPQLVSDHAYTLISASMVNGVATYVVRNPWGVQGDSLENSQGYATLTFAQLESNFVDGCQAT